jgi:tetratricopeptide (TPR) repeat protein
LQQEQLVSICAVSGMGGIGKTELAVQYVQHHLRQQTYPGGVCWLNAQEEVGTQIIAFVRSQLEQEPPDKLELEDRVEWCWKQFQKLDSLIVFDGVQDYQAIKPFLPPIDLPFKILLTTRLKLQEDHVHLLTINKLQPLAAFQLLYETLQDESRLAKEQSLAEQLCEWLGYLPLGIKLVAKFLKVEPDLSLQALLVQLETEKLKHDGLTPITAVFELSWKKLSIAERQLAVLLSLFAVAPIEWRLVGEVVQGCRKQPIKQGWVKRLLSLGRRQPEPQQWCELIEPKSLERGRRRLVELSLLQYGATETYQLHPLIREFFAAKLSDAERKPLKRAFATTMIRVANQIPQDPTLELMQTVTAAIPHIKEAAEDLRKLEHVNDLYLQNGDDLSWAFIGIGRFYEGQGLYAEAAPWYKDCLSVVRLLLGEQHPHVAMSLNNLALLYQSQGHYEDAEPLYQQALALRRSLLGEQHPHVAMSLNNLAGLYESQGRYEDAEPLYQQALALRRSLLGEQHPHVAGSLNNLAGLYKSQGRYEDAEPLYQQALALYRSLLGEQHPHVAGSLNNLAGLYKSQGRYEDAEPLYQQALALCRSLLGEQHPHVATSLNNLALLYQFQERYEDAEPLYQQALALRRSLLGEQHPHVATSLHNLAALYESQRHYEDAEPLYQQALALRRSLLGEQHPTVATSIWCLAVLYTNQERFTEAEPLYIAAISVFYQRLGETHPYTQRIRRNLISLLQRVVQDNRTDELSDHPMTRSLLQQLQDEES